MKKQISALLILALLLTGCSLTRGKEEKQTTTEEILAQASGTDTYYDPNSNIPEYTGTATQTDSTVPEDPASWTMNDIPEYSGNPYIVINNDEPFFTADEMTTECYTYYGELDSLGRAQYSMGVICKDELAEGSRGEIGHIRPSGWNQNKYEGVVDTEPPYLMQRSHLLMWKMTGDSSNIPENLISGCQYFNAQMLEQETIVLNYIKSGGKVVYRVTPYYKGDNLLATGVLMEAASPENPGEFKMCRFVYNVQPGIEIDYATGENWLAQ